jgi:hypothetical protein
VRGVENVEVDMERNRATIHLAEGNKARLGPLFSRITQDGTKIRASARIKRPPPSSRKTTGCMKFAEFFRGRARSPTPCCRRIRSNPCRLSRRSFQRRPQYMSSSSTASELS